MNYYHAFGGVCVARRFRNPTRRGSKYLHGCFYRNILTDEQTTRGYYEKIAASVNEKIIFDKTSCGTIIIIVRIQ